MLIVETPRAPLPALVRLVLQAMEQVVKVTIKLSSIEDKLTTSTFDLNWDAVVLLDVTLCTKSTL